MSCHDCRDLLLDYEHGELDAAADARVFEHLQLCPECKAQWQEDLALAEGLRKAFATELDLPMSVVAGVRQAVRADRTPGFVTSLRNLLRPVVVAPAAAVILLAVGLAYDASHNSSSQPRLSTDFFVRQHLEQTIGAQSTDRAYSAYLLTSANEQQANGGPP